MATLITAIDYSGSKKLEKRIEVERMFKK